MSVSVESLMFEDAPNSPASVASFLKAISDATEKLNVLSTKVYEVSLRTGSIVRTLQNLADHATRITPLSQAIATHSECRCNCDSKPNIIVSWLDALTKWLHSSWLAGLAGVFLGGGFLIKTAQLWLAPVRTIAALAGPTLSKLLKPIGRAIVPMLATIWRLVAESEIFAAIAAGLGVIRSALSTLQRILIAIGSVIGGIVLFEVWRHWDAIESAMRRLPSWLAGKEMALGRELLDSDERMGRWYDASKNPIGWPRYPGAIALGENSRQGAVLPVWELTKPRLERFLTGVRVNALAAILAAPLSIAPTAAGLTSIPAPYEVARTAAVTINSSPTISISASDCHDIEKRVLAALKEHQNMLFEQWCTELQRRQRTEF